jgi:hypothetical protein
MPLRAVSFVVLIAAGSLLAAACQGSPSIAAAPGGAAPRPVAEASPAVTRTPSGIFVSTSVRPTAAVATATLESGSNAIIVQGRVYDAGHGQRLDNATIEWQFLSPDWQHYDGQLQVPADGLYRLQLPIRSDDEVIITAQAPGYQPSMARLLGRQLNLYGSRLNFGLVAADGPAPTLPGALGTVQLSGIVYNAAHGRRDPIADARVTLVARSVVRPEARLAATTGVSGTFLIPVALHATDQVEVKIAASGFLTVTLTRSATELARKPQLAIGLQPAPKP